MMAESYIKSNIHETLSITTEVPNEKNIGINNIPISIFSPFVV